MRQSKIKALIQRIRYYEWAYGHLGESDTDIGTIGEFMVGSLLNCLPFARKDQDVFDLTTKSGVSIEVKTTTRKVKGGCGGQPYYRWHIADQRTALEGTKPLASVWIFLIATFPGAAATIRSFNAFDPRYWTVYLATGEQVKSTGCKSYIAESNLRRLGLASFAFAELKRKMIKYNVKEKEALGDFSCGVAN